MQYKYESSVQAELKHRGQQAFESAKEIILDQCSKTNQSISKTKERNIYF